MPDERIQRFANETDFAEEKKLYEAAGFLHLPGLISREHLAEIERNLAAYIESVAPALPTEDIVYEPTAAGSPTKIRNLWRMDRHSPYFSELAGSAGLRGLLGTLLNGEPVVMTVELFAKPARVGSAVPFHQDNAYFNLVPPDALTCWIAIDDSTIENGCIHYLRGSHKPGLRRHVPSGVRGNSQMLADTALAADFEDVLGILSPGDAVLHHCCLWHRSEPNLSDRWRRGLLIVYRGAHCRVDPVGARNYMEALTALSEHQ